MTKKEEKVLLPTATNKFLMQWKGPFKTVKKKSIAGEAVVEIEDDDGNETLTTRSKEKRSNRWDINLTNYLLRHVTLFVRRSGRWWKLVLSSHPIADNCYPMVIVKKKDGKNRFCIDFRAINKIIVFDAETISSADDIFVKLAWRKYVSKFDLAESYKQLPLDDSSKQITAFQTLLGLYQYTVMPLWLVNGSASYSRLSVDNFIDDIITCISTFQEHSSVFREFFQRLWNLTAKQSKCFTGYRSLEYLDHIAGDEVETFTRDSDCYPKLQPTYNLEEGTVIHWYSGFLQEVHCEFFRNSSTFDWPH